MMKIQNLYFVTNKSKNFVRQVLFAVVNNLFSRVLDLKHNYDF